tara:strand:+ start:2176 stop:2883 length:708 start_codon:yes stop_codon:yes gene_type:complete
MAYQTFGAQITSLTGMDLSNSTNQGYVDSYLTNAARDVLSMVPFEHLAEYSIITTLNNSSTTLSNIDNMIILTVLRKYDQKSTTSEVGRYRECRKVPFTNLGIAEEDSGYIESNSIEDPVYYTYNNTLYVLPKPDATYDAKVSYISLPTVLYSESAIADFPKLLEQAVVYRAAADAARFLLQDEQDEDIYVPIIKDLTNQFANSLKLFLSKFGKNEPIAQQKVSKRDELLKMLGD